jgi:superfamily II DNA or RNA helicase
VVDEAHGSVAPTYTEILAWLGLSQRETQRFLLGLTATPFRGRAHDDEETRRLVARYGQRRFDYGVFEDDDPYPPLQRMGVLSGVDHEVLPGSSVLLTREEMESLAQYRVLPSSAEERLGQDKVRNESLVGAIEKLDSTWPVVVFGTSVGHSQLLASLLSVRGVSARAIWGGMDTWARRHSIEAFREGEIRVLVNYGVLTTGFDAPKTRALVVARPVFSPGLYQQMIGRGLRGPANGGTERCLIINVEDNVLEYGEELAFRHFEYLWKR